MKKALIYVVVFRPRGPKAKSQFSVANVARSFPDSFGPEVKIRMNQRDGIFPERHNLYILSLKLAGYDGSVVKISFNLRISISPQGPKIALFSDPFCTFFFDSFGPGVKIRINQRDGILLKTSKLYISFKPGLF